MQGSRDRCGGERKDIHVLLHLLDLLFVRDAESLLFVYDQKSQILEFYVLGEKSVRADDDIAGPLGDLPDRLLLLCRRPESGQHADIDRIPVHSLAERIVMLLGKNGRGHQDCHLLALLDCFEGCSDGDLCFAVAHIPADQAVHNAVALHVLLGLFDGRDLVVRLLIGKHFLEFVLPDGIGSEPVSFLLVPRRIELHQILRHFIDRALDPALGGVPLL